MCQQMCQHIQAETTKISFTVKPQTSEKFLHCSKDAWAQKTTFLNFKSWLWKHAPGTFPLRATHQSFYLFIFCYKSAACSQCSESRGCRLMCRRTTRLEIRRRCKNPPFPLPRTHFPPGNRTGGTSLPGDTVTTRKTNVEPTWLVESGWQIICWGLISMINEWFQGEICM